MELSIVYWGVSIAKSGYNFKGGVKKVILLGGAQSGLPPPPSPVVVKVPLFCWNFFFLRNP